MKILLMAKLMNKALLTSHVLNSYGQGLDFLPYLTYLGYGLVFPRTFNLSIFKTSIYSRYSGFVNKMVIRYTAYVKRGAASTSIV